MMLRVVMLVSFRFLGSSVDQGASYRSARVRTGRVVHCVRKHPMHWALRPAYREKEKKEVRDWYCGIVRGRYVAFIISWPIEISLQLLQNKYLRVNNTKPLCVWPKAVVDKSRTFYLPLSYFLWGGGLYFFFTLLQFDKWWDFERCFSWKINQINVEIVYLFFHSQRRFWEIARYTGHQPPLQTVFVTFSTFIDNRDNIRTSIGYVNDTVVTESFSITISNFEIRK